MNNRVTSVLPSIIEVETDIGVYDDSIAPEIEKIALGEVDLKSVTKQKDLLKSDS
jgi:hypothetical protein